MAKALSATCEGGVVKVAGVVVPDVVVLGEGVAASEGVLHLQGKELRIYVPKTSPDLKTTLEKVSDALGAAASALTTIDNKPAGTNPPAPAVSGNVSTINTAKAALDSLRGALK